MINTYKVSTVEQVSYSFFKIKKTVQHIDNFFFERKMREDNIDLSQHFGNSPFLSVDSTILKTIVCNTH
ncbi:hypothetical protein AWE51_13080 [Aquimarina aggregata]|uniref:Uncharacterized protein n=1 Tax=Aquimarina aggregata TaxID=1642818 RepID=A0A162XBG3_9FLAO|nr:hypothetical protein AWE51_13080 [Aquimarina aggregata]